MVDEFRTRLPVSRWIDAGKCSKIMNEVSLIEVTGVQRDVSPVDLPAIGNSLQSLLKAQHAAEDFRRKPYFAPEDIDEVACAKSRFFDDLRDRSGPFT